MVTPSLSMVVNSESASPESTKIEPVTTTIGPDADTDPGSFGAEAVTLIPAVPQVEGEGKDANYFGKEAIIKTFYEGPSSPCHCCINWVEHKPPQLSEATAKSYDEAAIRLYKVKDHSSDSSVFAHLRALRFHSIEIQSPFILTAIKQILEDSGTFLRDNQTAKFVAPFHELYFAHSKIVHLQQQHNVQDITKKHLELLTKLMDELFGVTAAEVNGLIEKKLISFDHVWTIFPRGITVYSNADGHDRLYQVASITLIPATFQVPTRRWQITCQYVQFDGTDFGLSTTSHLIADFKGNQRISSLSVYPLGFHENLDLEARLVKRGKRMLDFQDMSYHEYNGIAIDGKSNEKYNITGRIVIDILTYGKHNVDLAWKVEPIDGQKIVSSNPFPSPHQIQGDLDYDEITGVYKVRPTTSKKRPNADKQEKNKKTMLEKQQYLLLMSPMLAGFSLKERKWLIFDIDNVKPITWNEEAYDHLVYSEEYKDMALTFVQNHQRLNKGTDDVIIGKGQGLIFLLSGPPGTGKTLTAEAIADRTRRPLYNLQADELGTDPSSLDAKLVKVLEMGTEWDAIILLDEADVFLAKRSPDNLLRSELVSIFLRELEYFQGIMFLTTNLLSTIDDAFGSRIHIHLLFSALSFGSRMEIWKKFLSRLPSEGTNLHGVPEIGEEDLKELAAWELNGRQIKNALKITSTWCHCKGLRMTLMKLESGIQVTAPQAKKTAAVED